MSKIRQILSWIAQHIVIVVSAIVIVAAMPAGLILGMGKAAKIRSEAASDIERRMRSINMAPFNYELPPLLSTQQPASFRRPPNKATNQAVAAYMRESAAVADQTYAAALSWNSADRPLLVEGLFPAPDPSQVASKLQEVIRVWPLAQRQALREFGAGSPPDPAQVRARIDAERDLWLRRAAERGESAEEASKSPDLRKRLSEVRVGMYMERARNLTFYAADDAIANVQPWAATDLPGLDVAWDWQFRTWFHHDILKALALANTDSAGVRQSVLDGPVKRIIGVSVAPWRYEGQAPQQPISALAPIPMNFEVSFTGLGAPSPLYDARYATASVVIDSARLPRLLDAFNAAGLMTVIDVRLDDYDARPDLQEGFAYGGGALVRATLRIESIWLREWMAPLMPEKVRQALGVPPPQTAADAIPASAGSSP